MSLQKKSHRVVIKIHVSVSGGRVRWCSCTCRTLLHSSSYPPCFQVCLLLVKPHTGCLLRRRTQTLVGTASQRHRRDLYYNTAPETWPLVPLPSPTGAPARQPQRRCSVPHTAMKLQWIQVRGCEQEPVSLYLALPAVSRKVLELDIKRNKRANRVRFLCLIKERRSQERQWWIHLSALRIALRIYSWQLDWGDGRAGERVGSWIRVTQPPSLYSISGN